MRDFTTYQLFLIILGFLSNISDEVVDKEDVEMVKDVLGQLYMRAAIHETGES